MGETAGDYFSFGLHLGYGLSAILLTVFLFAALLAEWRSKKPTENRYWLTIVIMSTTGTALADYLSRTLQWGYGWSSLFLVVLFGIIYYCRKFYLSKSQKADYFVEHLELNQKRLPATDVFYWATILVASTFGTTMGDFVSDAMGWGFGVSSLVLFSLLLAVLFFEYLSRRENTLFYWVALVFSSTIGATSGDYLTKPDALGLGYGWGSFILIAIFILIFLFRSIVFRRTERAKAGA